MDDVRLYDLSTGAPVLFRILPRIKEALWQPQYCGAGSVELRLLFDPELIADIEDRRHILVTQGELQCLTVGRTCDEGEIILYGRTPEYLLSYRLIGAEDKRQGTMDAIAGYLIQTYYSDLLTYSGPEGDTTPGTLFQNSEEYKNGYDLIVDMLGSGGVGFSIKYDFSADRWLYRTNGGRDNALVLSHDRLNILSNRYETDMLDYSTIRCLFSADAMVYAGSLGSLGGITSDPHPERIGTYYEITREGYSPDGTHWYSGDLMAYIYSRGKYTQIKHDHLNDTWLTFASRSDPSGILKREAVLPFKGSESATMAQTAAPSVKVSCEAHGLEYGRDYKLGDRIALAPSFGSVTLPERTCRVVGVKIYFQPDGSGNKPILEDITNG